MFEDSSYNNSVRPKNGMNRTMRKPARAFEDVRPIPHVDRVIQEPGTHVSTLRHRASGGQGKNLSCRPCPVVIQSWQTYPSVVCVSRGAALLARRWSVMSARRETERLAVRPGVCGFARNHLNRQSDTPSSIRDSKYPTIASGVPFTTFAALTGTRRQR